ncbi:MAG: LpxD N-terminal domain-containing protein, partial [Acidobacteriota bacterium]
MKLSEIASVSGATLVQGDPDIEISSAAGLDNAGAGQITFLANPKYTPQIRTTHASAIF